MSEKTKILWINPAFNEDAFDEHIKRILESVKHPDVAVDVVHLPKGPESLEYWSNESVILTDLFKTIYEAERGHYHAVVVGCFGDPGLRGARELVKIPVVGVGEACMHVASTLGHKFSILAGGRKAMTILEDLVYTYGLEKNLASIRVIDFDPVRMRREPQKLQAVVSSEARKALEDDNAEVIIVGCTCGSGIDVRKLITQLKVPVIDVVAVSFKYAEMLADLYRKMGLSHSKIYGYRSPPEDELFLHYTQRARNEKLKHQTKQIVASTYKNFHRLLKKPLLENLNFSK